jgi:hypothetical protein
VFQTELAAGLPTVTDGPVRTFLNDFGFTYPGSDGYTVTWYPDVGATGQSATVGIIRQELNGRDVVWQCDNGSVSVSAGVRSLLLNSDAILPDSGRAFPGDLWDVRIGASTVWRLDNNWILGGGVSVGSASDKPFHSVDEMNVGVNAFLRIPSCERNAWLFSLSYSVTGDVTFPIPGVAYIWQVSDDLRLTIGVPFAVMWRPIEDLTFDASYVPVTNVRAAVRYRLAPQWQLHAGFDMGGEGYFLADRTDPNERFFYYEKRVSTGVAWKPFAGGTLDLIGGFSFDREFYQSHGGISGGHTDQVDLENGAFLALKFELRY